MTAIIKRLYRSKITRSMVLSGVMKPVTILLMLIYTPLLLNYLGDEKYGIWATLTSIVNWLNLCDFGIDNGLRNNLVGEIARDDKISIRKSVSTAYIILGIVSVALATITTIVSLGFNWNHFLNTSIHVTDTFTISFFLVSINFTVGIGRSIQYALQRAEVVSFLSVIVSFLQLLGILILGKTTTKNMGMVALVYGLSSTIAFLGNDLILGQKDRCFRPSFFYFDKDRIKPLLSMGGLFFVTRLGGIVMFSTDNVLISRLYNPILVTPYQMVTSFFSSFEAVYIAFITPIWSRASLAVAQDNYSWIRKALRYLSMLMILMSCAFIMVSFFFKPIAGVWLRRNLVYPDGLIAVTTITIIAEMVSMTFSYVMNGMNILKIQVIIAIVQAVANIPLSVFFATTCGMGVVGIKLSTMLLFILSAVVYGGFLLRAVRVDNSSHVKEGV